jgi:dethiobiotin synthetase
MTWSGRSVPSSDLMHSGEEAVRPERLVVVTGTGTEVGKTWVGAAVASEAVRRGIRVSARKPLQSFDPGLAEPTDADVLGAATGEDPRRVCPPHRWYEVAVAPPMAAGVLGRPLIRVDELLAELEWTDGVGLGLVEGAGGLRSPIAEDGDTLTLIERLDPDHVLVVADAGLGTIHAVRSTVAALGPLEVPYTVLLNRYDGGDLHDWNRRWLVERDGMDVVVDPAGALAAIAPPR